jgi:hypothetical protein
MKLHDLFVPKWGNHTNTGFQRVTRMPATFFIVRAVVAPPYRERFDHWYSTEHVPMALDVFKCRKAWRFWSEAEEGVHVAAYEFADSAALEAALASDGFKDMVAEFNAAWPEGVTRSWDKLRLVEAREGS